MSLRLKIRWMLMQCWWCGASGIMVQLTRSAWRRNGNNDGRNNGVTVVIGAVQWTGSCDCDKRPGDRPPAPRRPRRINNTSARPPPRSTIIRSSEQCRRRSSCSSYRFIYYRRWGGGSTSMRQREPHTSAEHPMTTNEREWDS